MQRVELPSGKAAFPTDLSEAEVRRLAGAAAFAQADAWERAGHVREATASATQLRARVLGTWRRSDSVSATIESNQLKTYCTGEGATQGGQKDAGVCRHAAALLLHWLRQPTTFIADEGDAPVDIGAWDLLGEADDGKDAGMTGEQLAGLLAAWTSTDLRALARRRNLRVSAHNKQELVEQLATGLMQPESIDAALDDLDANARLMLYLVALLGPGGTAVTAASLQSAFSAIMDSSDRAAWLTAAQTLVERALIATNRPQVAPYSTFHTPLEVAQRLPPWPDVLSPVEERAGRSVAADARRSLDIHQLLAIVLQAIGRGQVGNELRTVDPDSFLPPLPGWLLGPRSVAHRQTLYGRQDVQVVPLPPMLNDPDRKRLAQLAGQPLQEIDFVLHLLFDLGVIRVPESTLEIDEGAARALLSLGRRNRLALLLNTWLGSRDSSDLSMLSEQGHRLELHLNVTASTWNRSQLGATAVRKLVARLLMYLDPTQSHWYDLPSLLELFWKVTPHGMLGGDARMGPSVWWFVDRAQDNRRLEPTKRPDWETVWGPLVAYLLTGPLAWLGLVEVSPIENGRQFFRLRPAAAILSNREYVESAGIRSEPPAFDVQGGEPIVTLPAGFDDEAVTRLLARYGDVADVSAQGVRYRLSRDRLQIAFDDGLTATDLIESLTGGGQSPAWAMPSDVRTVIENWGAAFGLVRLYDDLTLVELGDDVLLRELLATSSLPAKLIYTVSPRTVVVDSASVAELVAELTRLGYTPRVLDAP